MSRPVALALRRALAAVVLFGGVSSAAFLAIPRHETRLGATLGGTMQPVVLSTPSWTTPVGIAIGLAAIAVAVLLFRSRPG